LSGLTVTVNSKDVAVGVKAFTDDSLVRSRGLDGRSTKVLQTLNF
jgi:hypothetical protein